MSTKHFSLAHNGQRQKRFSIDDAFEEETDEAIKVYGATTNPLGKDGGDFTGVKIDTARFGFIQLNFI